MSLTPPAIESIPFAGTQAINTSPPINTLRLSNFLGGLNLNRGDNALLDNESGDLCNVDILGTSGLCRRHPVRVHTREDLPSQITGLAQWQDEEGNPVLYMILENGEVYGTQSDRPNQAVPIRQPLTVAPGGITQAIEIGFNQYFYSDEADAQCVEGGIASGGGTVTEVPWASVDAVPGFDTDCTGELIAVGCNDEGFADLTDEQDFVFGFPRARAMAVHADFAWAANTVEDGVRHCNRLRRSFPLTGAAETGQVWGSQEYIDIDQGDGDCINALVSCGPNLYVIKSRSIYIIQGWDEPTGGQIRSVQICADAGTMSPNTAVCCNCDLYFWDQARGLFRARGTEVAHVFSKLEDLVRLGCIRPDCEPAIGCCNGRIFVSVPEFPVTPEDEDAAQALPDDCSNTTTYVMTPLGDTESWVKHTHGFDAYLNWRPRNSIPRCLASSSVNGNFAVNEIERPGFENFPTDVFNRADGATEYESFWRSAWFTGNNPFANKRWGRPHVLAQSAPVQTLSGVQDRQFDLDIAYLADWCIESQIGGGVLSFFEEQESTSKPVMEVTTIDGAPERICPPEAEVSDATCPITNLKKELQCAPEVVDSARAMQVIITGPSNAPWCVCEILLGFTQEQFNF